MFGTGGFTKGSWYVPNIIIIVNPSSNKQPIIKIVDIWDDKETADPDLYWKLSAISSKLQESIGSNVVDVINCESL